MCNGVGRCPPPELARAGEPAWLQASAPAIRALGLIERHGVQGWLLVEGTDGVDTRLFEQAEFLAGELAELEHQDRVGEAEKERARRGG